MKNLEKFNAATTPLGTQLITRDGREVTEWYYFKSADANYPVYAVLNGSLDTFTELGKHEINSDENIYDLFIKPKIQEIWVNVFKRSDGTIFNGSAHETEKSAIEGRERNQRFNINNTWLKTIKITDEI